jgi:hypothetical protein
MASIAMVSRTTAAAGLSSSQLTASRQLSQPRSLWPALPMRKASAFRCMASPLKDAEKNVDQTRGKVESYVESTKVDVTKDAVQKHQESGAGDEKRSVVGSKPAPGNDQLPRPEVGG